MMGMLAQPQQCSAQHPAIDVVVEVVALGGGQEFAGGNRACAGVES